MTEILYSAVYYIPLSIAAAFELIHYAADIPEGTGQGMILIPILLVSLLLATLVNTGNKIRAVILAGLGAIALGLYIVVDNEAVSEWLTENGWIRTVAAAAVVVAVLEIMMIKIRLVKLGVTAVLAGVLVSSYWTGLIHEKISVVSIVFLTLTILLEEIRRRKRGTDNIVPFVVRTVPFLIIGMLGLFYIPHSDVPYDWAFVKNIYNSISDDIYILVRSFDKRDSMGNMMSTLGFSEDAGLSGDAADNPEEVMRILIGANASKYLYLDGKYFENFNGTEWTEAEVSYPYMLDLIETSCTLSLIDQSKLSDYRRIEEINVLYLRQNTKYVFAPPKSYASLINVNDTDVDYTGNEILFNKRRGLNTEYKVRHLLINRNESIIRKLLENVELINQDVWNTNCSKSELNAGTYSYTDFLEYREVLYSGILCPDAVSRSLLSEETAAFLAKATEGTYTDYDKLTSLEKAFADFQYTTSPGEIPKDIDTPYEFLDYFITDKRKGYCNSFATAFVLLCQAEGIPARYVHGYLVPRENGGDSPVYSSMAHAYAEAYVKGIGWTVFDPTPGFNVSISWNERGDFDYSTLPDRIFNEWPEMPEEYESFSSEEVQKHGIRLYMIAIPAALLIVVLSIFIILERILNRRRFEKMAKEEKAYTKCLWIMEILKHMKFVKGDSETVAEYAVRALTERDIKLAAFSKIMDKLLYSTNGIEDREYECLNKEYDEVLNKPKGREKLIVNFLRFLYMS